jgi:cell division protein FtsQ
MPEATARRRRVVALLIAGPMLFACVCWGLTYTPVFAARHIRVNGNGVLSDRFVRSMTGVSPSTNIVHLDVGDVVARLEQDPWVSGASVRRDLPDTLIVTIDERQPIGLVSALGDTSILASDGTTLPVRGLRTAGLPSVRAALGAPSVEQLGAAAALLQALAPVVLGRVHEVLVGEDGIVSLTMVSGAVVDAGERGQEPQKADALRAVLRWAAKEDVKPTSIDVSTPTAASVKLDDGSTASI